MLLRSPAASSACLLKLHRCVAPASPLKHQAAPLCTNMAMDEIVSIVPNFAGVEAGSPQSSPSLSKDQNTEPTEPMGQGKKGKLSTFKTYVNLVTVVIGAGIMALPQLPLRGGWLMSSLILLLVVVCSMESGLYMWKAFMASQASQGRIPMSTYEDLGREAWGPVGQILTAVVTNIFLFGVYSAYAVLIGMQLENISHQALDKRFWIPILYPVFVCLALTRDLSSLSRLVPLGFLAACGLAAVIIGKSILDAHHWQAWDQEQRRDLHSAWPEALLSQSKAPPPLPKKGCPIKLSESFSVRRSPGCPWGSSWRLASVQSPTSPWSLPSCRTT